ncbi:MAG: hypothetical protein AAF412_08000 [Pseudomonadota bacterium]
MRKLLFLFIPSLIIVACTSRDVGPYVLSAEDKSLEQKAAANAMCAIQNQARCDHLIENRTLFGRFFAPQTLGGMDESEKFRGRSVTTKVVVEALSAINQCTRVTGNSVTIIKGMQIDGKKFDVQGSSPLVEGQSACFIEPSPEES